MGVIWKNRTAFNGKTLYHPTFYHHWFKTITCSDKQLSTQHMVSTLTPVLLHLTLRLLMSYTYGAPILDVSRSHTMTHHSRQDSPGRVISSSQRPLPDNTRHSQQTNIHAPGGIRTQDLSRRAAWSLRRADRSSRGVLPTVLRCCV